MLWFLPALMAIAALPFVRELMRKPMNDQERSQAPGRFATLSQGVTHYDWIGPEGGPVVLCIHGQSTPCFAYRAMAEKLAKMGFRVLIFDLYGRGYSDRPRGAQDSAFFNRQIDDLLADQQVGDDLTVIGYSMGGAIAAGFVGQHPDRVRRMVLLAPAGVASVMSEKMRKLIALPFIGDWVLHMLYPRTLRKGIEAERSLPPSGPNIGDKQLQELEYRGFMPAVVSSMHGILAQPRIDDHSQIAKTATPMLAIWGGDDDLIGKSARGDLKRLNPSAIQRVIDGAGHGLPYTHSAEVIQIIDDWLTNAGA